MTDVLPSFRYHPDPVRSGVLAESDTVCRACGQARGWIYTGPSYGPEDLDEAMCPWCIADGTAARLLDASFSSDHSLRASGLASDIVEEVTLRTPGYVCWQSEDWAVYCEDACAFVGDMAKVDLASDRDAQAWIASKLRLDDADL